MRSRRVVPPRARRRRRLLVVLLGLLLVFGAASVRLFVLPPRDAPRPADAVVVLGGTSQRIGIRLVQEGYAPTLLLSVPGPGCVPPIPVPRGRLLCFRPQPFSTRGEARDVTAIARQNGWKHLMVVVVNDQNVRARLRFRRCTTMDIAFVPQPTPPRLLAYRIAYEWAALSKALVLQRGC
jgi:uncharacterized SAM-binding protein YcdF (DUF218 family)